MGINFCGKRQLILGSLTGADSNYAMAIVTILLSGFDPLEEL